MIVDRLETLLWFEALLALTRPVRPSAIDCAQWMVQGEGYRARVLA